MLKRMTLLHRRDGMSRAAFDSHWRGSHAEIAARLPGVRGYVQNPVQSSLREDVHALDGIVELWFDDAAAMSAAYASPVADELRADEPAFLSGITILSVDEIGHRIPGESWVWVISDLALSPDAAAGGLLNAVSDVSARPGLRSLRDGPVSLLRLPVGATLPDLPPGRISVYSCTSRSIVELPAASGM
ncbi:MAG: EthD family reductase [Pararhodobacter sp.]|nr:EthD family reductase [Pararhodobacter sp.]